MSRPRRPRPGSGRRASTAPACTRWPFTARSSDRKYGTAHALCGAHLLRELDAVHHADPTGQRWAKAALDALTDARDAAETARAEGRTTLHHTEITALEAAFDQAVACGRS